MYLTSREDGVSDRFRSIGICVGASTISIVKAERAQFSINPISSNGKRVIEILDYALFPHGGNPKKILLAALKDIDIESFKRVVITGRKFRKFLNVSSISECEAVEYAYRFVKSSQMPCKAVVSAGGETFIAYVLSSKGQICNVLSGNKCASGTGEFFLQQLRRMNLSVDEVSNWTVGDNPYSISGRCSVFCKSDCTHASNAGVPKPKIVAGLCKMMAGKIIELLKGLKKSHIMIIGGTTRNSMMVKYLKDEISNLIIPPEAPYFEALGAALWAMEHETIPFPGFLKLIKSDVSSFDRLPALRDFAHLVEYRYVSYKNILPGDECILGIDVGSTTTKAVLLRKHDSSPLASVYLRTNGDPVKASRECYLSILKQIIKSLDPSEVVICGLGVCGSGRHIVGLHALTDGIVNEIIAHATAAVFFDETIDTIFEIGGQDAKYTYIINGVPSDYAMNEACSAGTGSFLEESAFETLGIDMSAIADIALTGDIPPNFNDQCAAFIASDIKNAIHEGLDDKNITAGLVYSICMNYCNRVIGSRKIGNKVMMQGGVCYNKAVPLAMASILGKFIIVPPEPGLMGAFGAALEVNKRIEAGLLLKKYFDLKRLIDREVNDRKPFRCAGGKDKCDRGCVISLIELEGKLYPFGGACNRYYNMRKKVRHNTKKLNLVRLRQNLVFDPLINAPSVDPQPTFKGTVGINRSFLVNSFFPLYHNFFREVGFEIVIPNEIDRKGIDRKGAAFCFPAELSHGFFYSLLSMKKVPDFIFMPHFKGLPASKEVSKSQVCPFVQGETFYLSAAFKAELNELKKGGLRILSPLLDLSKGIEAAQKPLIETALKMGIKNQQASLAFKNAQNRQEIFFSEMIKIGDDSLKLLEQNKENISVVLFARPYNGFAEEAHMGIPDKFASRGIQIIPFDFLPFENETSKEHMYWGMGQSLLKACRFVKRHPQLFAVFITNFSCGPDSFILGYFRDIMGQKPSLTLELDSHTADAGIETRIDAFLDVIFSYRKLFSKKSCAPNKRSFTAAKTIITGGGIPNFMTSSGRLIPFSDNRVTFLLPSMGKLGTDAVEAVFRYSGYNAVSHPPPDESTLKLGRANTSCKECLPLILTTGTLINYIQNQRKQNELLVYFMPTGSGPCRFGQYSVFLKDLIRRLKIPDVTLFSPSSVNGYAGFTISFQKRVWWAMVVADIMEDIRSMILANASDLEMAMQQFVFYWQKIASSIERGDFRLMNTLLVKTAEGFSHIPMQQPPENVPKIALIGEIYVRRDSLSRQFLTEYLARHGFATICAPVIEWIYYTDYLIEQGLCDSPKTLIGWLSFMAKKRFMAKCENRCKMVLKKSGLTNVKPINLEHIIERATPYLSPNLAGEAILTVGSAHCEIATNACGVIAIGPFGCMPNRLAEAIINESLGAHERDTLSPNISGEVSFLPSDQDLPFLAIESDGSPFPQLITAKLESFFLRARRLHEKMLLKN